MNAVSLATATGDALSAKILAETKLLLHESYRRGGVDSILSEWDATTRENLTRTTHFEVA